MPSDTPMSFSLPTREDVSYLVSQQASFERACKRGLDVSVAAIMIFLLLPLMVCICVLVRLGSAGPVLFRQARIGMGGRKFECLKFRTMILDADAALQELSKKSPEARYEWEQTFKLKKDPRITLFGHFLRRTSLEELPQLFNVLAGEMSLVGPPPVVAAETSRYGNALPVYLSVRPGLTGLWQVSGRSECSYAVRVALDEQYVRTWSLWNDVKIIMRTVDVVLRQRGSC